MSHYRNLVTAQPGWMVFSFTDQPPFYHTQRVICWAIDDRERQGGDLDSGIVPLIMDEEFWTLSEPIYDRSYLLGIHHENDLTDEFKERLSAAGKVLAARDRSMTAEEFEKWSQAIEAGDTDAAEAVAAPAAKRSHDWFGSSIDRG